MRIIKECNPSETKETCINCRSVFAYTSDDEEILEGFKEHIISSHEIESVYGVECPVCGCPVVTNIHLVVSLYK